ncbi:hypothetical protein BJY52DRAFT_1386749 [Lactarius psammicola]|nr:hypothetical protein BJY52DRAFT_1386749 [Lactarius psammicola]
MRVYNPTAIELEHTILDSRAWKGAYTPLLVGNEFPLPLRTLHRSISLRPKAWPFPDQLAGYNRTWSRKWVVKVRNRGGTDAFQFGLTRAQAQLRERARYLNTPSEFKDQGCEPNTLRVAALCRPIVSSPSHTGTAELRGRASYTHQQPVIAHSVLSLPLHKWAQFHWTDGEETPRNCAYRSIGRGAYLPLVETTQQ